jgi:hypothetical protein
VHTFKFTVNQTDACKAQYPADASDIRAFRTAATPPAYGWNCYIPSTPLAAAAGPATFYHD